MIDAKKCRFYIIVRSTLYSIMSYINYDNNKQPLDAISQ